MTPGKERTWILYTLIHTSISFQDRSLFLSAATLHTFTEEVQAHHNVFSIDMHAVSNIIGTIQISPPHVPIHGDTGSSCGYRLGQHLNKHFKWKRL